jgi:hypothetical protein
VCSRSSSRTSFGIRLPILSMRNGEFKAVDSDGPCAHCHYDSMHSKTVTALDVVYALKRSGRTLYGFGA